MEKRWSKAEIAHLKRFAKSNSLEELAQRLKTDQAVIQRKLVELGLGSESSASREDDALKLFAKGVGLLYEKKWKKASETLRQVIEGTDDHQLRDRGRQYLQICLRHTGEPTSAEPYLEAVIAKNRGEYEAALELCQKAGPVDKDERYAYLAASIEALSGELKQALDHLTLAIQLEPKNRVHAYHDPDFEPLRGQEEFTQLLSAPSS